jgi:hypothetical protein
MRRTEAVASLITTSGARRRGYPRCRSVAREGLDQLAQMRPASVNGTSERCLRPYAC